MATAAYPTLPLLSSTGKSYDYPEILDFPNHKQKRSSSQITLPIVGHCLPLGIYGSLPRKIKKQGCRRPCHHARVTITTRKAGSTVEPTRYALRSAVVLQPKLAVRPVGWLQR